MDRSTEMQNLLKIKFCAILADLKMTNFMDMESVFGHMEVYMKDSG